MNCLFQTLFSIKAFRQAVFDCQNNNECKIINALQRIFYRLQQPIDKNNQDDD